jgi:hypothetical protein
LTSYALKVMAVTSLAVFLDLAGLAWGDPLPSTVNLAPLHGVASANAVWNDFVPSRTIDGDWLTYWVAPAHGTPANPLWVQVDLQKKYLVDRIILVDPHGELIPSHFYNLYTSADGVNWHLVNSGTFPDDQGYVHTVPLTSNKVMQYAKYEVVGGEDWASFSEMEIWGDPIPFPHPVPLPILLLD